MQRGGVAVEGWGWGKLATSGPDHNKLVLVNDLLHARGVGRAGLGHHDGVGAGAALGLGVLYDGGEVAGRIANVHIVVLRARIVARAAKRWVALDRLAHRGAFAVRVVLAIRAKLVALEYLRAGSGGAMSDRLRIGLWMGKVFSCHSRRA